MLEPVAQYSKYKNISFQQRKNCMVCNASLERPLLTWPNYPMTELYVDRPVAKGLGEVDLELQVCNHCSHVQLANVIDAKLQYSETSFYNFRTSQSITGRETTGFFINFMEQVLADNNNGTDWGTIAEIGCNDTYLLNCLKPRAKKLYGIDPILHGHEDQHSDSQLTVYGDFFENVELPEKLDIIICKDVLEHVEEPVEFIRKLTLKAHDNTMLFVQVPIIETILDDVRFDQIFHQHLNYFSIFSFETMLAQLDYELVSHTINHRHWGAAIFAFKKISRPTDKRKTGIPFINADIVNSKYQLFTRIMATTRQYLLDCPEPVYGYGAALMLAVLNFHLQGELENLQYIIDDNPDKAGKYYLQLPVEIKHSSEVSGWEDKNILITSISSSINVKCIMQKLFELNPRKIINPLVII